MHNNIYTPNQAYMITKSKGGTILELAKAFWLVLAYFKPNLSHL